MKANHELITVEGFWERKPVSNPKNASNFQKHVTYAFDGYRLDNLKITLDIKSFTDAEYIISDIKELITLLEIHKRCLQVFIK